MKKTKDINHIEKILIYQDKKLSSIEFPSINKLEEIINDTEKLLEDIDLPINNSIEEKNVDISKNDYILLPNWDQMCLKAQDSINENFEFESLFNDKELENNRRTIEVFSNEFNSIHQLDIKDIFICAFASIVASTVDILLIGIPKKSKKGLNAKPLSNFIRDSLNKVFPPGELENLAKTKVPYDAQDNRNTIKQVEGLSAYYHRLLTLGHDPFLGLIFGVLDILNGTMTSIDKNGDFLVQVMENYKDRTEEDILKAIIKQILHFKSDITTEMGLPAPLMSVFNLFQFGEIGDENQTIAEIVQSMYYEGFDFIHFISQSISTMIIEIIVRASYSLIKINNGKAIKNAIPFTADREKNPKLGTMLFIAHTQTTAINAGLVYFTENPMAFNYSQWLTFAKYSFLQLKWVVFNKPNLRDKYIDRILDKNMNDIINEINNTFDHRLMNTKIVV